MSYKSKNKEKKDGKFSNEIKLYSFNGDWPCYKYYLYIMGALSPDIESPRKPAHFDTVLSVAAHKVWGRLKPLERNIIQQHIKI